MLAARRAVVPFIFVLCATAYVWAQRAGDSQTRIANVTPVTTAMLEAPAPSDWLHWRRTIDQTVKQDNLPPAPYYSDPVYAGRKILATTPHPLSPDTPGYSESGSDTFTIVRCAVRFRSPRIQER